VKWLKLGGAWAVLAAVLMACSAPPVATPTPDADPDLKGDPELAATLPRLIGGTRIVVFSMRGPDFVATAEADPALLEFIDRLGVSTDDVSVAFGFCADPKADVLAFRAAGVDDEELVRQFQAVNERSGSGEVGWESDTIGGKGVQVTASDDLGDGTLYLYAHGDTLYVVVTPERATAREVLRTLP
jgi:hypothetical protein